MAESDQNVLSTKFSPICCVYYVGIEAVVYMWHIQTHKNMHGIVKAHIIVSDMCFADTYQLLYGYSFEIHACSLV